MATRGTPTTKPQPIRATPVSTGTVVFVVLVIIFATALAIGAFIWAGVDYSLIKSGSLCEPCVNGSDGAVGPAGPQGPTGSPGATGATGPAFPQLFSATGNFGGGSSTLAPLTTNSNGFQTENNDPTGSYTPGTSTFVVPDTGVYVLECAGSYAGLAGFNTGVDTMVNGAVQLMNGVTMITQMYQVFNNPSTVLAVSFTGTLITASTIRTLTAGDIITCRLRNDGQVPITYDETTMDFNAHRIF